MRSLHHLKERWSEARLHSQLEAYEHLWTDDLAEHVLLRVRSEDGAVGHLIEHAPTHTPVVIEDERIAPLVVEKMLQAGVRVVDEGILDRFIVEHPRLSGFLAWFIDATEQGFTDEELARSFVSPQDPEGDRAMIAEGRQVLADADFPDEEVSRCANRYFAEPNACREWLGKMLSIAEETVNRRQEEIAQALKTWEGTHPLPDVRPERCSWCRKGSDSFFVVLWESSAETREMQSEVICAQCAPVGRAYIFLRKQGVTRKQILRDFGIRT